MSRMVRLLTWLFPLEEIHTDGDLYLRRWRILGYNARLPSLFGRSLMLHQILRPDADRDPHCHPWSFTSLVLRGGYVEHIYDATEMKDRPRRAIENVRWIIRRPGDIDHRPAPHLHRIDALRNGPAWTLVLYYGRHRNWGFWTRAGWVHWRDYIAGKQAAGSDTTASISADGARR